jgi:hypothetical protein
MNSNRWGTRGAAGTAKREARKGEAPSAGTLEASTRAGTLESHNPRCAWHDSNVRPLASEATYTYIEEPSQGDVTTGGVGTTVVSQDRLSRQAPLSYMVGCPTFCATACGREAWTCFDGAPWCVECAREYIASGAHAEFEARPSSARLVAYLAGVRRSRAHSSFGGWR